MQIYIAGIEFDSDIIFPDDKVEKVISHLNVINEKAKKELGSDVIIFVVLNEYSITSIPVSEKIYQKLLLSLKKAIKRYPNMVLVPGSFSSIESFADYEKNKNKIIDTKLKSIKRKFKNTSFFLDKIDIEDFCLNEHKSQFKNIYNDYFLNKNDSSFFKKNNFLIKNISCFITGDHVIKYKKSFPCDEFKQVSHKKREHCVFNIGDHDIIKEIYINGHAVNAGINICYDAYYLNRDHINDYPLVHVIVSASVTINQNNLLGALTIHMDKEGSLSVYINDLHPDRGKINAFAAGLFKLSCHNVNYQSVVANARNLNSDNHTNAYASNQGQDENRLNIKFK